jgi:thiol-disulfide isomerase/thioredoxin
LPENEIASVRTDESLTDAEREEKLAVVMKRRSARVTVLRIVAAVLMVATLGGALYYYNFVDKAPSGELSGGSGNVPTFDPGRTGKVTVINFWFTTCGPCLHELPYFYQVAGDYADRVSVVAVHIEQRNVNVTDFIQNGSGHPEWNDGTMLIGWDTSSYCLKLFRIQACPVTVVINADGVITDYFVGSLMKDELVAAVEKALGNG